MAAWFICIVGLIATIGCGGALNESLSEFATPPVQTAVGVSAESLLKALETLAFDEFAGRAPGSPGEALTIDYLSPNSSGRSGSLLGILTAHGCTRFSSSKSRPSLVTRLS